MSRRTRAESAQPQGSTALPFPVALGHRLRQVREQRGGTASSVAETCRTVGLKWDRTILARVELGQRHVTASELLLLALVYERSVADLLPTERVRLGEGDRATTANPEALRSCLTNPPGDEGWTLPGVEEELRELADYFLNPPAPQLAALESQRAREVPGARNALRVAQAAAHAKDETTTKAARSLGATPLQVAVAAQLLWDRSLGAERDARESDLGEVPDRRARQARRGHITRRLLVELRPILDQVTTAPDDEEERGHGER